MVQGYTSAACRRAESSGFDASARGTYSQYLIRLNGSKPLSGCEGDPPLGWPRYVRPVCPPLQRKKPRTHESGAFSCPAGGGGGRLGLGEFLVRLADQGQAVADVAHGADQVLVVRAELCP